MRANAPVGRDVSGSSIARDIVERAEVSGSTASVTLVVFGDYRCPACRAANPALQAAVAKDGDTDLVIREWPVFGERSEELAQIAIAASYQDLHAPLHDVLMRTADLSDTEVARVFEGLGGDWTRLQSDLNQRADDINAELLATERDALQLSLRGTPAYLTRSNLVVGGVRQQKFLRLLDQAREP